MFCFCFCFSLCCCCSGSRSSPRQTSHILLLLLLLLLLPLPLSMWVGDTPFCFVVVVFIYSPVFLPLFCCCCCRCCFLAAYCLAFGLCWLLFVCFWPINGLCHIPLPPCITALPPSAMHLSHASLLLSAFNGAFKVTFVFPSPALAWVRLRILFYARLSRSFTQRFFLASKLLPSCLLRKL